MKTEKLGPPQYPYPIQKCIPPKKAGWLASLICSMFGHVQCGFHWEQHEEFCCRCLKEE